VDSPSQSNKENQMPATFRLSGELKSRIDTLAIDLDAEIQELREQWDDTSDDWQESDIGNDVLTWIDDLSDMVDELGNLKAKP
jgi:hypothetical protein